MSKMVPSMVLAIDLGIYWIISIIVFSLMDVYAWKKMGGKQALGYKVLRIPKFLALITVSAYTIILLLMAIKGFTVSNTILTYLGLPYFLAWTFYLVNMLRRVRAETNGNNME